MAESERSDPPPTRREEAVDVLHGVDVADPYRWLEDGESLEVAAWVAAQNAHTRAALDGRGRRQEWQRRLAELVALPTVLGCKVRADKLFVLERAAGADQFALVLRSASDPTVVPRILLDPADAASDAAVAIDWFEPSPDGALVALGLSEGGTEESTLQILSVDDAVIGGEQIPRTRASSVAWMPDSSGFWYARYPEDDQYNRHIFFHSIGSDPEADPVVFDRLPTKESWPEVQVSEDGRWLLVEMLVGWSRIDAHLLDTTTGGWSCVVSDVEARTSFTFVGDLLVGTTTLDAANGRLVSAPLTSPNHANWTTVVAEREGVVLSRPVECGGDVLVVASRGAIDGVERWTVAGECVDTLDDLGLVAVQQLVADSDSGDAFLTVASFDSPVAVWRYSGGAVTRWCPAPADPEVVPRLVIDDLVYPSLDGTEIGLFVIRRQDVTPSPETPLVLNGYGGFAITESPTWLPNLAAWCAGGGVWAIAGLRGGYEHGERWHHAGRRANKQNVFDDFHAAGDWLVANGMASNERMALVGGSNGGLLVGVAATQRPDLARAIWCAVPLLDMIRFPQFLIARLWTDEYGDPDAAEEFGWLRAYSPYHNVTEDRRYPAVLFTTAEGDTRVDPLHARKMAALLQHAAADQDDRPVLLMQAGRSGHGVGKPANMRIAEGTDVLSFLWWQLGQDS